MTKIEYIVENEKGFILWAVSEHFAELVNKTYNISDMEAIKIEKIDNLSLTAKILLSAVAGAIIQHLIDKNIDINKIFSFGTFRICKDD